MDISNCKDIIDSRDVIERIEELEDELESAKDEIEEENEDEENEENEKRNLEDEYGDEIKELKILKELEGEARGGDWLYGEALIHEDYFTEYCEDMCKDIGDISQDLPWYIESCIDWDGVADNIKADYTEVDFDGQTYLIRA